jgi:hypothetical protein
LSQLKTPSLPVRIFEKKNNGMAMIFEALLTPLLRGVGGVFFQNSIKTSKL